MSTITSPRAADRRFFALSIFVAVISGMAIKLHSPIAQLLYEKFEHTQDHLESTHEYWYTVRSNLLSKYAMDRFVRAHQDEETTQFLKSCFDKSDWFFTQLYHTISRSILTCFMTLTSCNGLLNRGSMFVFSSALFRYLLDADENWKAPKLLDLGAGDGRVTMRMAPMFDEVYVTEISPVMRWRLRQANFTVLEVEEWDKAPAEVGATTARQYDVVACLNLLDRCASPLTLLRRMRAVLTPTTGRLVLALVFPLTQYVETTAKNEPLEMMEVSKSRAWEVQFDSFLTNVLQPAGFDLIRWTRVPYLCEGDFSRSFYSLNDVVMIVKPSGDPSQPYVPHNSHHFSLTSSILS
ncbi:methyltransferase9 [Echinococcus multilocularis]|uniref:Methyltransferase9 n=1 Tax=Echinococcus multilocularis TaxID=6211 RepID=A0A068Y522_ECHMU|nr:methyltransferase9 [Echinococcus multilocularis]